MSLGPQEKMSRTKKNTMVVCQKWAIWRMSRSLLCDMLLMKHGARQDPLSAFPKGKVKRKQEDDEKR